MTIQVFMRVCISVLGAAKLPSIDEFCSRTYDCGSTEAQDQFLARGAGGDRVACRARPAASPMSAGMRSGLDAALLDTARS